MKLKRVIFLISVAIAALATLTNCGEPTPGKDHAYVKFRMQGVE